MAATPAQVTNRTSIRTKEGFAEICIGAIGELVQAAEAGTALPEGYPDLLAQRVTGAIRPLAAPPVESVELIRYAFRHAKSAAATGEEFDYVLVDSRTGLADVASFCVRGLADNRVLLSGLNRQNLEGLRWILEHLLTGKDREASTVFVISPVPEAEIELLDRRVKEWRRAAATERVELLHYHPPVAIEEDAFSGGAFGLTRLAHDYDRLCNRVQEMNHDVPEAWIRGADWFKELVSRLS